jgi:putative heme-binding domain-containing protein
MVQRGIEKLSPLYPAKTWPLNRELSQVLIYLDAPGVVSKTLALMASASTQEEQLHYISALRKAKTWTLDERKQWFSWFQTRPLPSQIKHPAEFVQWFEDVGIKAGNGNSYANFIKKLKKEVADGLSESDRTQLAAYISDTPVAAVIPKPQKQHAFVREWKMADFANDINGPSRGRNYANGHEAFLGAQCVQCHRFNNEGGGVGPDLSGAGAKYTRRDLLESILEPSKVISDQYQNITVIQRDGEEVTGILVEDTPAQLVLLVNGLTGQKAEVKTRDVKSRAPSKLSPMPEGLASVLTKDEILDLIAYIESAGNPKHAAFRP